MNTLPAVKIAKLIPRLGSTFDGEVVATARAIERTLKATGQDWHDVARVVWNEPSHVHAHGHQSASPPLWAELAPPERLAWLNALRRRCVLTEWETCFVAAMSAQVCRSLSPKQQIVLNRLIGHAFAMGVSP